MLGDARRQRGTLVLHLAGAIADDVPRAAIVEALIQLSVYGGFQAALNAFTAADKAFASPRRRRRTTVPRGPGWRFPAIAPYAASKGG